MKIDNVDLICSAQANVINMSFRDPGATNPYTAKAIVGLDADEIVPRFYGRSLSNGTSKFYSLSLEKRDVVVRILLNPDFSADETYSDLRDYVYKTISSSRTGQVTIMFKEGTTELAAVMGFITKVEAPHFNEIPEIQITISCDDPMLRGAATVDYDLTGLVQDAPVIVDSLSTAPHGFKAQLTFNVNSPDFTIADDALDPSWQFQISPVGGFGSGDILYFSSENNDKYLYMVRSGVTTHLVDKIAPGGVWPVLFPGSNAFVCDDVVDWDEITYIPAYWGI